MIPIRIAQTNDYHCLDVVCGRLSAKLHSARHDMGAVCTSLHVLFPNVIARRVASRQSPQGVHRGGEKLPSRCAQGANCSPGVHKERPLTELCDRLLCTRGNQNTPCAQNKINFNATRLIFNYKKEKNFMNLFYNLPFIRLILSNFRIKK